MSVNLTKPYAKSHLNIVIKGKGGEHNVKLLQISGHPMSQAAYKRAIIALQETLANGNRIVSATLSLVTEELKEKCCKVFQPKEIRALKS
jgi:hypothetical protein